MNMQVSTRALLCPHLLQLAAYSQLLTAVAWQVQRQTPAKERRW